MDLRRITVLATALILPAALAACSDDDTDDPGGSVPVVSVGSLPMATTPMLPATTLPAP
jgi:hypothetical protein